MTESKAHIYQPKGDLIVEGPDAAHFLQGQFSQDLRVSAGSMVYGLWLDAKGKIQADSFLLKESEDRFRAISYFSPTSLMQENLEKRIIMDEVETRTSESLATGISLWGKAIEMGLDLLKIDEPEPERISMGPSRAAFWGRRSEEPNVEVVLMTEKNEIQLLLEKLEDKKSSILNTEDVAVAALKDRRFQVGKDVVAADLPQETGLSEDGVSYQKGCYIGQEVMARLNSMGIARKSLQCVTVSNTPKGEGPWELIDDEGRKAGELRRVLGYKSELIGSAMVKHSLDGAVSFSVAGQSEIKVFR